MQTNLYPKTHKMILAILAFFMLTAIAVMPAQAKTAPPVPIICLNNCLRVTNITLTKDPASIGEISYVKAVVTVNQTTNSGKIGGLSGALVTAVWTLPDGSQMTAEGKTNAKGQAVLTVHQTPGEFTFTIVNVEKDKFIFDKWNSVLVKSIK